MVAPGAALSRRHSILVILCPVERAVVFNLARAAATALTSGCGAHRDRRTPEKERAMKNLIVAAVVAAVLGVGGTIRAADDCPQPTECCTWKKVVCYKVVIDYEVRTEKYVKCFVVYDKCGNPCKIQKVCYRDVTFPVKKVVAVVKWVKVCH
jgi:hypothetical protein